MNGGLAAEKWKMILNLKFPCKVLYGQGIYDISELY